MDVEAHFISDTHFGHRSIIEYSERPFASAEEMDEALIANWNDQVGPKDIVYHLGDWCLGHTPEELVEIVRRLNGRIITVLGNHDERTIAKKPHLFDGLLEIHLGLLEKKVQGQRIIMSHYPLVSWHNNHHGSWMLHGHQHGNGGAPIGKRLDIGVDSPWVTGKAEYRPFSFAEIRARMDTLEFVQVDHHRPKND